MVKLQKIRQKLDFLRKNLRTLKTFQQMSLEEFTNDPINCLAATRVLQISIEAIIDIANHIIAREGLGIPKTYQEAIGLLIANGYLPKENESNYRNMIKFRNRVVHLYEEVDEKEVYRIIINNLDDFTDFIRVMVERYFR